MPYPGSTTATSDKFSLINRRNLSNTDFTRSLIAEALRVNLLPIRVVDDLQMQIMGKLDTVMRERAKELHIANPSSLDETETRSLLSSVFFTLDTYLFGFHDPMYAISALQSTGVEEMYAGGKQQLKALLCEAVAMSVHVRKNRIPTDCRRYNQTLDTDIRTCLGAYDYHFRAHEVPLSFVYGLSEDMNRYRGIYYIRNYLRLLREETEFLGLFDPEERELLFASYAKQKKIQTADIGDSLFRIVFSNAIGAAMLGKYTGILTLTEQEVSALYAGLDRKTTRELDTLSEEALAAIRRDLHITDAGIGVCLLNALKGFRKQLTIAKADREASLLFVPADPMDRFRV